jgi:hypothetical protein
MLQKKLLLDQRSKCKCVSNFAYVQDAMHPLNLVGRCSIKLPDRSEGLPSDACGYE